MQIPRVVIAGTHSGVGKTTIATGIMAALTQEGVSVQGYKVGPDYIDPTYHTLATGRSSRNLDRWLLTSHLREVFTSTAPGNWAVIEGVMGMFDGMSGTMGYGSTADIARELGSPVILVVDGTSMARSAAALVYGYQNFEPEVLVSGVIFNRVKSEMHDKILRAAISELGIPVLGCLPVEARLRLPERHLGLIPVGEHKLRDEYINDLAFTIRQFLDLDLLKGLMLKAPEYPVNKDEKNIELDKVIKINRMSEEDEQKGKDIDLGIHKHNYNYNDRITDCEIKINHQIPFRMGYARDEAFLFYYQDGLETLKKIGFSLVPFSPLHDLSLPPELDGILIGGGFPELFLEQLSQNYSMLNSIREFNVSGKPIYAECGGYMYLGQSISDFSGNSYPMAGIIPMNSEMTSRLQGMGYRRGELLNDSFFGKEGTLVHGHEFHYSKVTYAGEHNPAYRLFKGENEFLEGYAQENILASYLHLNFAGHPEIIEFWYQSKRG